MLGLEEEIGFGIVVGNERRDQPPTILLPQFYVRNLELATEKRLQLRSSSCSLSEAGKGAKPHNTQVLVFILDHAFGGKALQAGGEPVLRLLGEVAMNGPLAMGDDARAERLIALRRQCGERHLQIVARRKGREADRLPEGAPE